MGLSGMVSGSGVGRSRAFRNHVDSLLLRGRAAARAGAYAASSCEMMSGKGISHGARKQGVGNVDGNLLEVVSSPPRIAAQQALGSKLLVDSRAALQKWCGK
ncbi:hypothetical protein COLO4_13220 [Corchorus olitorius]|uniref:Uncharacterized protein n=1 Tax=Corchorus olitorius TaxID=93759 RepID=A0A1R3JXL3_9ROSI|nr:hypothetical protein COLO4_13220 [Corchorus olitorius]